MINFIAAIGLIILAAAFRTVWHIAPNVELVTAVTLVAGVYLRWEWSLLVPLATMAITDKSLGTTNIFWFVWSAYLLIGLVNWLVIKKVGRDKIVIKQLGAALAASGFFYLYTNLGVWLTDQWGMYTRDLAGLIKCYWLGLPFYRNNFIGNLVAVPVLFGAIESVRIWLKSKKPAIERVWGENGFENQ